MQDCMQAIMKQIFYFHLRNPVQLSAFAAIFSKNFCAAIETVLLLSDM
jgi:hypothetical protein